jgi:ankyrin repeat protein
MLERVAVRGNRISLPALLVGAAFAGMVSAVDAAEPPAGARQRGNPLVCSDLNEKIRQRDRQINDRRLNILLFEASEKGCPDIVAGLIERGGAIDARDRTGSTALIHAATGGHVDVIALLLERGAEIEQVNLKGENALLRAVLANRSKAVEFLLTKGARSELTHGSGITPLAAAAFNGNLGLVKLLLAHGASPVEADGTGKGPILYAAGRGFAPIVAALLDGGAAVDHRYAHDLTALMWAAGYSNDVPAADGLKTVELLVGRGADVNAADDRGWSPLMIAAERGHAAVVSYLLARGADRSRRAKDGKTAEDVNSSESVRAALAGR